MPELSLNCSHLVEGGGGGERGEGGGRGEGETVELKGRVIDVSSEPIQESSI